VDNIKDNQAYRDVAMTDKQHDKTEVVYAICPSCGHRSSFKYLGTQIWPEEIAKRLGIPPRTELYLCDTCFSTISDRNMRED
jgi:hypothetical protein